MKMRFLLRFQHLPATWRTFTTILASISYQVQDSGWTNRIYSLADFAGQDIYIAFNEFVANTYTDGAAIFIDQVKVDQATAIAELLPAVNIKLTPNPAVDYLDISADCNIHNINIFSIEGDLVQSKPSGRRHTRISTSDLSAGLYIIRIESDFGSTVQKFCISR